MVSGQWPVDVCTLSNVSDSSSANHRRPHAMCLFLIYENCHYSSLIIWNLLGRNSKKYHSETVRNHRSQLRNTVVVVVMVDEKRFPEKRKESLSEMTTNMIVALTTDRYALLFSVRQRTVIACEWKPDNVGNSILIEAKENKRLYGLIKRIFV